jgi:hypothetical protein
MNSLLTVILFAAAMVASAGAFFSNSRKASAAKDKKIYRFVYVS